MIHPPIDLHLAIPSDIQPGDHYLCAGRLVSYKRTEILLEACQQLGRRLRIMGTGPELAALRRLAAGDPRIEFLGDLPTHKWWEQYAACRALLFAADEDFGMVPLEAQACGRPVIAYGAGGSLETVRATGPQPTGAYFGEQTAASAAQAIQQWEAHGERQFTPQNARQWAETFATPIFLERYRNFVLQRVPHALAYAASLQDAIALVAPNSR